MLPAKRKVHLFRETYECVFEEFTTKVGRATPAAPVCPGVGNADTEPETRSLFLGSSVTGSTVTGCSASLSPHPQAWVAAVWLREVTSFCFSLPELKLWKVRNVLRKRIMSSFRARRPFLQTNVRISHWSSSQRPVYTPG